MKHLLNSSTAELQRLQAEEAAFDEAQGLRGVDAAPLGRPDADAEAPPGLPSSSSSDEDESSSESESDSDLEAEEPGERLQQKQQQRQQYQQQKAADAQQRAAAKRAARQAAAVVLAEQRQKQLQADADSNAATLACTLPQEATSSGTPLPPGAAWQAAASQLRRVVSEGEGNDFVFLDAGSAPLSAAQVGAQLRQAVLPSPKHMAAALRAICGATEAAAHELLCGRRLPFFRVLLAWLWHMTLFQRLDELGALGDSLRLGGREGRGLRLLGGCQLQRLVGLPAALQACTQTERSRLPLPPGLADCLELPVEPEVAQCAELALRALARTLYSGPMHNWLQAVSVAGGREEGNPASAVHIKQHCSQPALLGCRSRANHPAAPLPRPPQALGFKLISQLAAPNGSFPTGVRQAASDLKVKRALWQ